MGRDEAIAEAMQEGRDVFGALCFYSRTGWSGPVEGWATGRDAVLIVGRERNRSCLGHCASFFDLSR